MKIGYIPSHKSTIIRYFDHVQDQQTFSCVECMGNISNINESKLDKFFKEHTAYSIDDLEIQIAPNIYACTDITDNRIIYWAEPLLDQYQIIQFYKESNN